MKPKGLSEVRKEAVRAPEGTEHTRPRRVFAPRADVLETADALVIAVDMPGVDERTVDITLEKDVLAIHGTVAAEVPKGYRLDYTEYAMGDWHREFILSDEVKRDGIQASMKNGVLRLILPKADPARKIQVRGE
jgi:HSP20 family molecular chaperone IbpA